MTKELKRTTITLEELQAKAVPLYGGDPLDWKFECPSCKTHQAAREIVDTGVSEDDARGYIGFSCIGRFNNKKRGCDWTLGGLFQLHEVEIDQGDGKLRPIFKLVEGAA